jgi:hypothetical protein
VVTMMMMYAVSWYWVVLDHYGLVGTLAAWVVEAALAVKSQWWLMVSPAQPEPLSLGLWDNPEQRLGAGHWRAAGYATLGRTDRQPGARQSSPLRCQPCARLV